jgi:hypothetical protein
MREHEPFRDPILQAFASIGEIAEPLQTFGFRRTPSFFGFRPVKFAVGFKYWSLLAPLRRILNSFPNRYVSLSKIVL